MTRQGYTLLEEALAHDGIQFEKTDKQAGSNLIGIAAKPPSSYGCRPFCFSPSYTKIYSVLEVSNSKYDEIVRTQEKDDLRVIFVTENASEGSVRIFKPQ